MRSRLCTGGSGSNITFVHGTPTCILNRNFLYDLEDGTILCQLARFRHCENDFPSAYPRGSAMHCSTRNRSILRHGEGDWGAESRSRSWHASAGVPDGVSSRV